MNRGLASTVEDLSYLWGSVRLRGSHTCCGLVHDGPYHCFLEFINKLKTVIKISRGFYLVFHLFPLFFKIKKAKTFKEVLMAVPQSAVNYMRSLLFMAFLVGLNRVGLCTNLFKNQTYLLNGEANLLIIGPISSVSILFEDASRRNEITYYICAKAIRSVFMGLKRVFHLEWKADSQLMHIILMALLYYIFNHHEKLLKFRYLYEFILGDS